MFTDLGFAILHGFGAEYYRILQLELLLLLLVQSLRGTRPVLQVLQLLEVRPEVRLELLDVAPSDHIPSQLLIVAIILTQMERDKRLGPP